MRSPRRASVETPAGGPAGRPSAIDAALPGGRLRGLSYSMQRFRGGHIDLWESSTTADGRLRDSISVLQHLHPSWTPGTGESFDPVRPSPGPGRPTGALGGPRRIPLPRPPLLDLRCLAVVVLHRQEGGPGAERALGDL